MTIFHSPLPISCCTGTDHGDYLGSASVLSLRIHWIKPIKYQSYFSETFRILHEIENIHYPDSLLGQVGRDIFSNQNDLPECIVYFQERPQLQVCRRVSDSLFENP